MKSCIYGIVHVFGFMFMLGLAMYGVVARSTVLVVAGIVGAFVIMRYFP